MSAQRSARGSLTDNEVHQIQVLATTAIQYLNRQRHAQQRIQKTPLVAVGTCFREVSYLDRSLAVTQYKESVPHSAQVPQSFMLIPRHSALPDPLGLETFQARLNVDARRSTPLSPKSAYRTEDVPVHRQLDDRAKAQQRSVDWAALVHLVQHAQAYYEAKVIPTRVDNAPMARHRGQHSLADRPTARMSERIEQQDSAPEDHPAQSTHHKGTPRIKHARRPLAAASSASGVQVEFETPSTIFLPTAMEGKRKAPTTSRSGPRKARKVSTGNRPQLGLDPDRPGLVILKVKVPGDDGSVGRFLAPQTLPHPRVISNTPGRDAIPKAAANRIRAIDTTPVSTSSNAVQVPDANSQGLSMFRARINKTVIPHLLEGMSYFAKHQPDNPLEWLADFCRIRSEIMEGPQPTPKVSETEAESTEENEARVAALSPPPSQATTPERATVEADPSRPLDQSSDHTSDRRSRSLTSDPVAAQEGMLRPPLAPDNASSADELPKPGLADTEPSYEVTTSPAIDSASATPAAGLSSESLETCHHKSSELETAPSEPQAHSQNPLDDITASYARLGEIETAAPSNDDASNSPDARSTHQATKVDSESSTLRPACAHAQLGSDLVRHHSHVAHVVIADPYPDQLGPLAECTTARKSRVGGPEILITSALPITDDLHQSQAQKPWDILDKELFGSRVATPEPPVP